MIIRVDWPLKGLALINVKRGVTAEELRETFPDETITLLDQPIEGVGTGEWQLEPWGYRHPRLDIDNVDHHGPDFDRCDSTTPLLDRYFAAGRSAKLSVITHSDCDSVLSAGRSTGVLRKFEERFALTSERWNRAALAADHTGEADPIAELLQTLEEDRDVVGSLTELEALLENRSWIKANLAERLESRLETRELAFRLAATGQRRIGRLTVVESPVAFESAFLLPAFPNAEFLMMVVPHSDGKFEVKMRLGRNHPIGASLHQLNLKTIDPEYGGRFNAGSNSRELGSWVTPARWISELVSRIHALFPL